MNNSDQQSLLQLLARLWRHINNRRRLQFAALILLMFVASMAEIFSIGAVLPFLGALTAPEKVFAHPRMQTTIQFLELTEPNHLLLPLTIVFATAALVSGLMRILFLVVQTRLSHAVGADLSIDIYQRTLYQPYAVHLSRNSSEVIVGISSHANTVVATMLMPASSLFNSALMLLAIMTALTVIDPYVSLSAVAGFGAIYGFVIHLTKKRLARDSLDASRQQIQVLKAIQEGLGGIRDVLIDGTQSTFCEIYRDADHKLRRAGANIQIMSASPRYGIEALGMILIAMLAYSLAKQADGGISNAIPVLGALALGTQRLLPVLQQAYANWTAVRGGQTSLGAVLDLLDQPLPAHALAPPLPPILFQRNIAIANLSFRYSPELKWVLQDVGLVIPKGSRTGFIGTTGSGKSTLLDIVMGLLEPTKGSLAVDGSVITTENCRAWQARIAHVPQAIFLADTTIAENIAFGVPQSHIDFGRVREAAEMAQLALTVESWDKKYQTLVGERGVRLSGGQRQRIGIARALYKRADVIVLDEATSALDGDTENSVMDAIECLSREITVLIVAHRVTTLRNCSQVIVLENGKIERSGSYQEIVGSAA